VLILTALSLLAVVSELKAGVYMCVFVCNTDVCIGSGITASVLYFALERAGAKDISVYDGSWTEYADKKDSIIIKDLQ
jgi:hypothetical protein